MPSGTQKVDVANNKDGSITVSYHPHERGVHEINASFNEKAIEGTPFRCHVDAVASGYVTAYGPGLSFGSSGEKANFVVVSGSQKVDINVEGQGHCDVSQSSVSPGVASVSYLPMSPGEYFINIKAGGKHINGSPFSAKVSGEGRKRSQISIPAKSVITLGSDQVDLAGMVGTIKTPSGASEPCLLKKMHDGKLGIASFTPKNLGRYTVDVKQDGRVIKGSPFTIDVGDGKVCAAQKVKVMGGLTEVAAGQWNDIKIDLSAAGHGGLSLSVEGPHRSDIVQKEESAEKYTLSYRPHEPGLYLVNLRFGDDHVPGSPFMVNVGGQSSGRTRETVEQTLSSVEPIGPGTKCMFQLKIPGCDPLDMEASLTSPTAKTELCEIRDLPDNLFEIKFVPSEEGVHTVSLKHKGLHISGSPFQYTVGKPPNAGAYKVEIGGPGMEKGEVGEKNEFNIYTREAGGGKLQVSVEGPSKARLEVIDRGNGYTTVGYVVSKEGQYGIHVKFNDEHVPDSPCNVYISPEAGDAKLVSISGLRDRGLDVDKPATFNVNLNGAKGELKSHLDTPSGTEEDLFRQELDREIFALRFLPKENGIYYVHVKLNEAHIPGSPFPMLVGKLGADPALVLAHGDGLASAECGKPAKFVVVTTNSGVGTLNATMEGPSKVAIQCTEVDEGYEFTYVPMAPGDYLITIKYCNITIAGCPTKAQVTGGAAKAKGGKGKASDIKETSSLVVETVEKKPGAKVQKRFVGDASKVVAKGNGLKKGFQNRPANFTIDVKDAGQGLLNMGMITPTGNPIEELSYKKTRATIYTINFKSKEKGDHSMHVRWGAEDIPGSPFNISIA